MDKIILIFGFFFSAITLKAQSNEIKIISYNIAMLGGDFLGKDAPGSQPFREERIKLIPNVVKDYDVVVILEAFNDDRRKELNNSLGKLGFQRSCILGSKDYNWCENGDVNGIGLGFTCQDGGVIIYSKYPIVQQDQQRYYDKTVCEGGLKNPECYGADCYAKKGALYVSINKNGSLYHIFGTHTQASYDNDSKYRSARKLQFKKLNNFILSKNIPKEEPVIIAGDLNVDMLKNNDEYTDMLSILNCIHPNIQGVRYTSGPQPNSCLDHSKFEYLDYILFRKDHILPSISYNETKLVKGTYKVQTGVWPFRSEKECEDISDHFPVVCTAQFSKNQGVFDASSSFGASWEEFNNKTRDFQQKGMSLKAIDSYVQNGQVFFNGVWKKSTVGYEWVLGWGWNDFVKKNEANWKKGLILQVLDSYIINGQVLFNGVWEQTNENSNYVIGWGWSDFIRVNQEYSNKGWRLKIINSYVINNQVLFNAVWTAGNQDSNWVLGWGWNDFVKKNEEYWKIGWQISTVDTYTVNGQVLFNACWQKNSNRGNYVLGYAISDFLKIKDKFATEGLNIVDVDSYFVGNNLTLNAIFRQQ